MKRVFTAQEMRDYEQIRFADGRANSLDWMERAAQGVDDLLKARYPEQSVLVVCGSGNNGGDGFALLRLLTQRGVDCLGVLLTDENKLSGDAKINYQRALRIGVSFALEITSERISNYDVVVDTMFGTGLSRPLTGVFLDAVQIINQCEKPVVAVDIPSGVDATTGAILGEAIRARETVTFECLKRGHLFFPGREYSGEVIIQPLSNEPKADNIKVALLEHNDIQHKLPPRPMDSHKGKNGRALLCVGCGRYVGAALLSVGAALRAGSGLTTAAVPGAVKPAFAALPEAMCVPVNTSADWDEAACYNAKELLSQKNAVCIGSGVGDGNILTLIEAVLKTKVPVVLDADALNQISRNTAILTLLHQDVILTPHPMEMSRLCGEPIEAILADPIGIAQIYAHKWNCVVLLKGATTCISNGSETRLNITGNAGLAKGGSGDVLSGLITGLLAQRVTPFDAASAGAYLLGASANEAFELLRERMLLARDVIDAIQITIGKIEQ